MAISKVVYGGEPLIDLTNDTVTANKLLSGYTAHDKAGNRITGTAQGAKPEQEKTVPITANGDIEILPDAGKVLKKVLAQVNVSGGSSNIDRGTFVVANVNDLSVIINHSLGVMPDFIFCMPPSAKWTYKSTTNEMSIWASFINPARTFVDVFYVHGKYERRYDTKKTRQLAYNPTEFDTSILSANQDVIEFKRSEDPNSPFSPNKYLWIAGMYE